MAHNLKDPLNGLLGFAEILADEAGLAGEPARYLEHIIQSTQRMNAITEELLLLARLRAQDVERVPLDMAPIVARSRARLAPLIVEHDAEILVSASWPRALGYASWVEEVWVNYLSNAIKYGGEPPRIELGASPLPPRSGPDAGPDPQGRYVRYWVRDSGPGITEDARPHLFTEFTRLGQVQIQGYGLGLSIVKRIVGKLGGRVGRTARRAPAHRIDGADLEGGAAGTAIGMRKEFFDLLDAGIFKDIQLLAGGSQQDSQQSPDRP